MKDFVFQYPIKVYLGEDAVQKYLANAVKPYGKKVMVTYGGGSVKKVGIFDEVVKALKSAGKEVVEFGGIKSNPKYAKLLEGAELAKKENVDFLLAVGGGSVIDGTKVISAMSKYDGDYWNDFNFYNKPQGPFEWIPFGAVVTCPGTGAEMNQGAVITNEALGIKDGLKGALADFAMLDPKFAVSLPTIQARSGAFDTLSHMMETYFCPPAEINVSDYMNEGAMRAQIDFMRAMVKDYDNLSIRSDLMWSSAMAENGILKIGKASDFEAHQIEHAIGGLTDCNHGQGLAVIQPQLYRVICTRRDLDRFARWAVEVWGIDPAGKGKEDLARAGVEALADFVKEMELPTKLSDLNITDDAILKKTSEICAMNYPDLTRDEVYEILQAVK